MWNSIVARTGRGTKPPVKLPSHRRFAAPVRQWPSEKAVVGAAVGAIEFVESQWDVHQMATEPRTPCASIGTRVGRDGATRVPILPPFPVAVPIP